MERKKKREVGIRYKVTIVRVRTHTHTHIGFYKFPVIRRLYDDEGSMEKKRETERNG